MKQTKVTTFKIASLALFVLAMLGKLIGHVSELIYISTVGALGFGRVITLILTCIISFVPYALILIGFFAFYKKGKSTVIFGAAFALLSLGFVLVLIRNIVGDTGYFFETLGNALERLFEGRRYWFQTLLNTIDLGVSWYLMPAFAALVNLVAAVNGFCKAKLSKLTIAVLVLNLVVRLGDEVFLLLRVLTSGGIKHVFEYYFDHMFYYTYSSFVGFVTALLFSLSVIVFLVYRIKSKKDVDEEPVKEESVEPLTEIPIVEEN